jgi:GT2 family glycosyltransferase
LNTKFASRAETGDWTRTPKVAAVILNWNGVKFIAECVDSLYSQSYRNLVVLLADNGSVDGSVELVKKAHPDLIVIQNGENVGTVGRNPALLRALEIGADYLFITDNDVVLPQDTIARLVDFLEANTGVGIAGPAIHGLTQGTKAPVVRISRRTAKVEIARYVEEPSPTSCIGIAMVSREAALAVGGYDPSYFVYYEDVDYCARAREAGFDVYIIPNVVLDHLAGASVKKIEGLNGFVSLRNRCIYARKHFPARARLSFIGFLPSQVLTTSLFFAKRRRFRDVLLMILGTGSGLSVLISGHESRILKNLSVFLMGRALLLESA